MAQVFLNLSSSLNRALNQDAVTTLRSLSLVQGETYQVNLAFYDGSTPVTPDISAFSFYLRTEAGADLVAVDSATAQGGAFPYYFILSASSPALSNVLGTSGYADLKGVISWEADGNIDVIEPFTIRVYASQSTSAVTYVSSLNGLASDVTIAGAGSVSVSQSGQEITITGEGGDTLTTSSDVSINSLSANNGVTLTGGVFTGNGSGITNLNVDFTGIALTSDLDNAVSTLNATVSTAQSTADTAESDAQTAINLAVNAQSAIDAAGADIINASSVASQAASDAQTALTNAAAATLTTSSDVSVNNVTTVADVNVGGILYANGITLNAGIFTGNGSGITNLNIDFSGVALTSDLDNAVSTLNGTISTAQSTADTAEADAQTALTNAGNAQDTANNAEADAQTAIANAATAQSAADSAATTAGNAASTTYADNVGSGTLLQAQAYTDSAIVSALGTFFSSFTGLVWSNGDGTIRQAVAGTDYVAP